MEANGNRNEFLAPPPRPRHTHTRTHPRPAWTCALPAHVRSPSLPSTHGSRARPSDARRHLPPRDRRARRGWPHPRRRGRGHDLLAWPGVPPGSGGHRGRGECERVTGVSGVAGGTRRERERVRRRRRRCARHAWGAPIELARVPPPPLSDTRRARLTPHAPALLSPMPPTQWSKVMSVPKDRMDAIQADFLKEVRRGGKREGAGARRWLDTAKLTPQLLSPFTRAGQGRPRGPPLLPDDAALHGGSVANGVSKEREEEREEGVPERAERDGHSIGGRGR